MSNSYHIEHTDGVTKVRFTDQPTYKEFKEIIDDIFDNYAYEKRLWDLSNINFKLTTKELHDIAVYCKRKYVEPNKMAIVSPSADVDVFLGIFDVYRSEEGHSFTKAFRSEPKAIEWLNE